MPDSVLCPIQPEIVDALRRGWTFTGSVRISLDDSNTLIVETLHDCFVMQCEHRGPDVRP